MNTPVDSDKQPSFYQDGLRFECTRCSNCCRHDPGFVFLAEEDVTRISKYLHIGRRDFQARYCREVEIGPARRLTIDERPNYDCVFWDTDGCGIYEVRPLQCRSYPFWPAVVDSESSWNEEASHCPGIHRGRVHSAEEIEAWLAAARTRRLIELKPHNRGG